MALNIRNPEAERLAADLARRTGESKTDAVITALKERLARVRRQRLKRSLRDDLQEIVSQFDRLPLLDRRTPDEIIGYDEGGLPR